MSDVCTGTYNDLCNTIFYFRKLQAPRSALVCGATCDMHVFAGFVDNFFGHFRPVIRYGTLLRGSQDFYQCYQYIHLPFDTKLSTRHAGCQLRSDEFRDSKITDRHAAPIQVCALNIALRNVAEDMKTILKGWEMSTRWHMQSEKHLSILI